MTARCMLSIAVVSSACPACGLRMEPTRVETTRLCLVETRHPLSDEKTSISDEHLIGDWEIRDGEEADVCHVRRRPGSQEMLEVSAQDGQGHVGRVPFFTTRIGTERYLCFRAEYLGFSELIDGSGQRRDNAYHFCLYEFPDEDTMTLYFPFFDADRIPAAVSSGELNGRISGEGGGSLFGIIPWPTARLVTLTDSPKRVTSFLEKYGRKCFDTTD